MINKKDIQNLLAAYMERNPEKQLFEVSVSVSPKNEIKVFVDAATGVDIDTCIAVSRHIENGLDRDKEDFELTVSSAGLDQPLKVPAQYIKNIGREVKAVLKGGSTIKGVITSATQNEFTLQPEAAKAKPKAKAKAKSAGSPENAGNETQSPVTVAYQEVKETKIILKF